MNKKIFIGVILMAVVLIAWSRFATQAPAPTDTNDTLVTTEGLHWHSNVSISVKGENVLIPANIGLRTGHNPVHTHDTEGTIHLEFRDTVYESDLRLGVLFEHWGREFSDTKLFEHVNSGDGKVAMYVNDEENTQFAEYIMQDEDDIRIVFE